MSEARRWYDSDPILKEALELFRLQPDSTKSEATDFLLNNMGDNSEYVFMHEHVERN